MKRNRGFVLLASAMGIAVFCGCLGLAIDCGYLALERRLAQNAADAAAIGAAFELEHGAAAWVEAGQADASLNGFTNGSAGVAVNLRSPPESGPYREDATAVEAVVTKHVSLYFLQALSVPSAKVAARSVAHVSANPKRVVLGE